MNRVARRGSIALILCLLLIAGFAFFVAEYAANAGKWIVFPGSPHVYNGLNIDCGRVVDREGNLLVDLADGRIYSQDPAIRTATVHWIGDREGRINAPALSSYAAQLAGYDLLSGTYSYSGAGAVAELSLSSAVQTAAMEAMGAYNGTVAVYNYKTGALLCAVTTPSFDPEAAPEDEYAAEGLYYNRFTQSAYTPGSIFKIVTLAAALEEGGFTDRTFHCQGAYRIENETVKCTGIHGDQDLQTAFRNSCNCAFAQIAVELGAQTLEKYVDAFGVTKAMEFDGITVSGGNFDLNNAPAYDVGWSGIGQYTDQVNPCAFLTFVGAIASEGQGVQPRLVERITDGAVTGYSASITKQERILSRETAATIAQYMRTNVAEKYGDENFPGLTVCAKTGTAEVGGTKKPNATLAGFVEDEQYPLAFVVFVEDGGYGAQICLPIASRVLAACKASMDMQG